MSTQAFLRGMYAGTTGDRTRTVQLRREIRTTSTVAQSWQMVGGYLKNSMDSSNPRSGRR
ncbi:hypothetical protein [Arachnia propionica]|uniref:hypothetical protein n=1 Tax=Arachnia propionica TaxID=1750 RepID=UPI003C6EC4DA